MIQNENNTADLYILTRNQHNSCVAKAITNESKMEPCPHNEMLLERNSQESKETSKQIFILAKS